MAERVHIPEAPVEEPVVMINAFTVPVGESDLFLDRWRANAAAMAAAPGYIRTRMHRAIVDNIELRFITYAEWESGRALAAARANPEWRETMMSMVNDPKLHITSRPGVYEIALDVGPGDTP